MTDETTTDRRGRGPAFWVSVGLGAAILIVMGAVMLSRTDPSYDQREPRNIPLEGAELAGMELPLLDGSGTLAFDDLEGQILVINFFASYCVPCRAEHTELTTVSEMYRDRGVQFVGIVYQDSASAASGFLDELGWGDGYLYVEDPGSRAVVELGVYGVPETYFVDTDGIIVHKEYGAVDRTILIPTLDAMLAGDPTG